MPGTEAKALINLLGLSPHPEGGWFRQTFVDDADDARAHSTAIYYLLETGDRSHWHRVDAAEVWHWYAGAPLDLSLHAGAKGEAITRITLGNDLMAGERPQAIVPVMHWQSAESLGEWTLVGCTVAPGFRFEGFEMAPMGWQPG
jgi:predicted cupin superfamily sugar epimerase